MRTKELIKELQQFGLTEPEARLYCAGLKSGSVLLAPLARAAEIPRSTAYEIVEQMVGRGLFSVEQQGKRTLYKASSGAQLLKNELSKVELLRQLLPHLEPKESADTVKELPSIETPLPFE